MKKLLQVSLIVVLALALVCMAFSVKGPGAGMAAGKVCPQVGWHTGNATCGKSLASIQGIAFILVPTPGYTTNVGWRG